jgi:hypothetical protein
VFTVLLFPFLQDIGWLQREPGMPPVTDGTERFLQLLGQTVHGIHSLPDDYVYLLTPGKQSALRRPFVPCL